MRKYIVLTILTLALCSSVVAAEKPALDVAIYPGGQPSMEVNLSQSDLLPALQGILPMVPLAGLNQILTPEAAAALLNGIKRFQYLQIDIVSNPVDTQVSDFYSKNLPAGEWNRVFWQKANIGTIAFYNQGTEKLYAFLVQQTTIDGKPAKRVQIIRAEGKIDLAQLLSIAAKTILK